jgi:hypothetical protein
MKSIFKTIAAIAGFCLVMLFVSIVARTFGAAGGRALAEQSIAAKSRSRPHTKPQQASVTPVAVEAQTATGEDAETDRRISSLEARITKLEEATKSSPRKALPPIATGNWKDLQNWRRLRKGMSHSQVRALLGEPEKIEGGYFTIWYWGQMSANVYFTDSGLYSWSEP